MVRCDLRNSNLISAWPTCDSNNFTSFTSTSSLEQLAEGGGSFGLAFSHISIISSQAFAMSFSWNNSAITYRFKKRPVGLYIFYYLWEYAPQGVRLLLGGLIALEDALDVGAEDAFVRVQLGELPAQPGGELDVGRHGAARRQWQVTGEDRWRDGRQMSLTSDYFQVIDWLAVKSYYFFFRIPSICERNCVFIFYYTLVHSF